MVSEMQKPTVFHLKLRTALGILARGAPSELEERLSTDQLLEIVLSFVRPGEKATAVWVAHFSQRRTFSDLFVVQLIRLSLRFQEDDKNLTAPVPPFVTRHGILLHLAFISF